MRYIVAIALLCLAPNARAECADRLPFPLPSEKVSAEWGDAEFEAWERAQWAAFCEPKHRSPKLAAALKAKRAKVCACRTGAK